jgi:hypothetical protein
MSGYPSRWHLVQAPSLSAASSSLASRFRESGDRAGEPVWQQILTWLLFWTMLSLIARQPVYVSGPARTAAASQNGAAMGLTRGTHIYLYLHLILLFAFVLAGYRTVWTVVSKNLAIPAMLILAVISARWSASPQITLQMCIEVGLCTLFGCYLGSRYTTQRLMELLMFMGVVSGLLSILFALELPNYGIFQGYGGGAWQGICDHKNTLGISSVYLLSPVGKDKLWCAAAVSDLYEPISRSMGLYRWHAPFYRLDLPDTNNHGARTDFHGGGFGYCHHLAGLFGDSFLARGSGLIGKRLLHDRPHANLL